MKRTYHTMADFHAEMARRGISKRALQRAIMPRPESVKPKPKAPRVITCAIHPLHVVTVRADGSRTGCDFCDDYIRDLCRTFEMKTFSSR